MALTAEFIPITSVKIGDRLVGGIVTGIRFSKSRKSVYLTMVGRRGEQEWPREDARIRTAVFSGADDLSPIQYRDHTLTQRPDGTVEVLSNQPGALLCVRQTMALAIQFADIWALSPEDYAVKYPEVETSHEL